MLSKHPPTNPVPYQGKLTIANAITDVTRLAGVQGDGAAYPDSSVGVWPEATNLITNGGFETDTTGWAALTNSTLSRTTAYAKFGSASGSVVCAGVGTNEGLERSTKAAISTSTAYTMSAWVKAPLGATLYLSMQEFLGGAFVRLTGNTNFVGTGDWQRVKFTGTTGAGVDGANTLIRTMTSAQAITFYVVGVQLETGSIATPYIETNGGTASRSAGRIQVPWAGLFTEAQGWVVARCNVPWVTAPNNAPTLFAFGDATNDLLMLFIATGQVSVQSDAPGGAAAATATQASVWAAGDNCTFAGAWEPGLVKASGLGAAFTSAARTEAPSVAATYADIGTRGTLTAGRESNVAFYWVAFGKGTLTDADAALFHSWGNNDPLPHMFPRSAQLTFLAHMNGDGTAYRYAA